MTVREIIIQHLKSIGADGLAGYDCGCGIDALAPCECLHIDECEPAHFIKCENCKTRDDCVYGEPTGDGCYFAIKEQEEER